MRKPFLESIAIMDGVPKNNKTWHTRVSNIGNLGFTFELSTEQQKREEEHNHEIAHVKTQMDLLTKLLLSGSS
ncbi:hypothetical protein KY290_001147 [Solanum tuberosum]|uniref:Uncharacterized protein n=1 Tax=Solanum tuberosum TaxID=4113 RepID=A0ABQ7WLG3_SOLTU|nr:hypothetical protein KY290_001147 [Solanum tuberosum]